MTRSIGNYLIHTGSYLLFLIVIISLLSPPALSDACPDISSFVAGQQMVTLGNDIRFHNQLYYQKAQPVISDAEYDSLFAALVQLERCFPALIKTDSPTRMVGSSVANDTKKVKHEQPMISLSSTTGPEAVEALFKRVGGDGNVKFLVQPKVDGVPVELMYEAGKLISASTRGDGRFGENVTEHVRKIKGIPHQLQGMFPDHLVVRGEVYAALPLLKKYMTENTAIMSHPRHIAAGALLAQKPDPAVVASLRLFPFELVNAASQSSNFSSDMASLMALSAWGFSIDLEQTIPVLDSVGVEAMYRTCLENRDKYPFAMDGIVVKVDDLSLRQKLGEGERSPFWAAAWKFLPDTAETKVLNIYWTVGRTGRRTPVAELVPVRLGGVQVSRVSLASAAEVAKLDIAAGDQVVVALVGDVIPHVVKVVGRSARVTSSVVVPVPVVQEPALDACLRDSPVCRNQFVAKVTYFVSKSGLHKAGLGKKRLQKLVEAGLIVDLPSLFLLKAERVAAVSGFGIETGQRITEAIRLASHTDSFRLVTALGITGVGSKSMQSLSRQFNSFDMLLEADQKKLGALSVKDTRTVKTLRSFFQSPGGQELLMKFRELGVL